ncbi:MAG TPA: zf-HC2 domain-containing protein, partial [Bryobacteraceae bacterium]|nr:zf-HC2 domain-containing protein [Bryobacteraceae bacterium]
MNRRELEKNVLNSIREDTPAQEVIESAAARVRLRLEAEFAAPAASPNEALRLDSCADFQALAPAYRNRTLNEARRMLLEDHLHSCVACRRFFKGERAAVVSIRTTKPVWRVMPWAIAAAAVAAVYFALPPLLDRVLSPSGPRATVASIQGELYRVSATGSAVLAAGAPIGENEEIRTG